MATDGWTPTYPLCPGCGELMDPQRNWRDTYVQESRWACSEPCAVHVRETSR